ncbi:hypothetical protein CKAH01_15029 [Colletotrichum kahawae]|uniref:Uncharacterized protein n=1 Tax=Colletotrichum kahawae TaxID=34407 RepID=A0AAD9YKH3_COLKA|nr:hypothetical protein CKAH01_15029 [Colletotrichum kahawae]
MPSIPSCMLPLNMLPGQASNFTPNLFSFFLSSLQSLSFETAIKSIWREKLGPHLARTHSRTACC